MSGVDKIVQKIMDDASAEAAAIISNAESKAADLAKKGEVAADKKAQQVIKEAEAEAIEIKKRRQSVCDLELRKNILAAKRLVIDEVFERVNAILINGDKAQYKTIMLNMLVDCAKTANGGIVVADADKEYIGQEMVDQAMKQLKEQGIERTITVLDEKSKIEHGFVFVTEGMEYNCSVDSMIRQARIDTETEVSQILFND